MKIPIITGTIRRRFLLNFRVDAAVLAQQLPAPFEPKIHNGFGIAGVCLIRFEGVRPKASPFPFGIDSENAAHRIAVEWDDKGQRQTGVYIPRRDTDSLLNHLAGGRIFPGVHHRARFKVEEGDRAVDFDMKSADGEVTISFRGRPASALPPSSIFHSLGETSRFFEEGAIGYSAKANPSRYDGVLLKTDRWKVTPFEVDKLQSSFFSDTSRFPPGSATFDHGLLMRDIPHEWHSMDDLCAKEAV